MLFIDNPEQNLDKYNFVYADKPSIGKRILATRRKQDERLPTTWDVEIADDPKTVDSSTRSAYVASKTGWNKIPTTSELIKDAQEAGYGKWYYME